MMAFLVLVKLAWSLKLNETLPTALLNRAYFKWSYSWVLPFIFKVTRSENDVGIIGFSIGL